MEILVFDTGSGFADGKKAAIDQMLLAYAKHPAKLEGNSIGMEKAKKLLLSTSLSVAEVAEQSGYGDYRVFTKVFKKSEGITPSQYRRDFLEETGTISN